MRNRSKVHRVVTTLDLTQGFEEIHVPALKPKPYGKDEKKVLVKDLAEWMQPAFAGMTELNRIQSRVCYMPFTCCGVQSESLQLTTACRPTRPSDPFVSCVVGHCASPDIYVSHETVLHHLSFCGTLISLRFSEQVAPTALQTSENILMCAPTGAGKTNVAMLAIMHTLSLYRNEDGSFNTRDFKIIYVAPMKASPPRSWSYPTHSTNIVLRCVVVGL